MVFSWLADVFKGKEGSEVGEVSELFIHPIRALRPVKMPKSWMLGPKGFVYDKGMCLLFKGSNERLKHTSPGFEALCGIDVSLSEDNKVTLTYKDKPDLVIDLNDFQNMENYTVETCPKGCEYVHVSQEASDWISEITGREVRLMFSPDKKTSGELMEIQSLDPVLIIGQASLQDFSKEAGWDVEMERFRPNIVSVNQGAYEDETWQEIQIGDAVLEFDHRCTRCLITNVNFDGVRTPDTMETLRRYRPRCEKTNKPVFGSYFSVKKTGLVSPGDKIILLKRRSV